MQVSIDVYTKNLTAALAVYLAASNDEDVEHVNMSTAKSDYTGELEYVNLMFSADHKSPIMNMLDNGEFSHDRSDMQE